MRLYGFRFFLFLCALEGLVISSTLYGSQQPGSRLLGSGYSTLNILLYFAVLLGTMASLVLLAAPSLRQGVSQRIAHFLEEDKRLIGMLVICSLILYESFQDVLFLRADIEKIHYQGYRLFLAELLPVIGLAFLISLQVIILSAGNHWHTMRAWLARITSSRPFYASIVLALLLVMVSVSGVGGIFASPRYPGFIVLSVPILGIQVLFVLLGLLLLVGFKQLFKLKINWDWFSSRDWLLMVLIGLAAFLAWISVPVGASAFTDIQRPPNFEFYPTSDALHFAQGAQQILVGNGFKNYSHVGFQLYLAGLHWLAEDGYQQILPLQLAILAFIPILLYRLASQLNNRTAGVLISMLTIIRARNGILLGEHVTNPSVVDLMSEPYGTLGVILVSTLFVSWYIKPASHRYHPLLMGGVIGLTAFIRAESLVIFPIVMVFMIYRDRNNWKTWIKSILSSGFGFILVVVPVLISQFYATQSAEVLLFGKARNFQWALPYYQSEKNVEKTNEKADLSDIYPYHVLNNFLQDVIYLPSNHQPLLTIASLSDILAGDSQLEDLEGDSFSQKYLERYARSLPYWWKGEWDGSLAPRSYLPVAGTLILKLMGFSLVTGEKRTAALGLIAFLVSHTLLYAFIGQSGGRFIQMTDWIPLVFYSIGLSWLLGKLLKYFELYTPDFWWKEPILGTDGKPIIPSVYPTIYLAISLLFLVVGLSFPAADNWVPQRYTLAGMEEIFTQIEDRSISDGAIINENSGDQMGLQVVFGKALYPRFFKAGTHMDDTRSGTVPDFSSSRIEFYLVGTENIWVSLPASSDSEGIPHGTDVVVVGIRQATIFNNMGKQISGDYIQASGVLIVNNDHFLEALHCLKCTDTKCDFVD